MRSEVERLLTPDGMNGQGAPKENKNALANKGMAHTFVSEKIEDRSKTYILARLKRDDPELAEKVFEGEIRLDSTHDPMTV